MARRTDQDSQQFGIDRHLGTSFSLNYTPRVRPLPGPLTGALAREGLGLTVLVLRLGALGDLLRTLPAVRLLRRGLRRARIFWVVEEHWRPVLDRHVDLDGLILLPRRSWDAFARSPTRWPALLGSIAGVGRGLRETRADLALDFHANLRSGLAGLLSGAAVRLGYSGHQQREGNRWLTTHRCPPGERRVSRIERNLDLLRPLGIATGPLPALDLPLVAAGGPAAGRIAATLGPDRPPFAIVNPGASRAQRYKKPPVAALAAACAPLRARGIIPLVAWGPGEEPDAAAVVEASGSAARLAPPTDLAVLAALLARARLFVGGDSGPLHLACAAGCPVVGLYGPTDPVVNGPWGVPHRVVHPAGRRYTGIKRRDRVGGFGGLSAATIAAAVAAVLDEAEA